MHWLSPVFYVKAKFGPLEKKIKITIDFIEVKFFKRIAGYTLF